MRWLFTFFYALSIVSLPLIGNEIDSSNLVTVKLIQEEHTVQAGRPFWVAIDLTIADGWHSYWKNPGDAGMATSIELQLPPDFVSSPIIWPTPERFNIDSMIGFGYEGHVTFLVQIMPPLKKTASSQEFAATVKWLVCSDTACIPGESSAKTVLKFENWSPTFNEEHAELFAMTRAAIPNKSNQATAHHHEKGIAVSLSLPIPTDSKLESIDFFPEENSLVDYKVEPSLIASAEENSSSQYSLLLKPQKDQTEKESKVLKGIVVATDNKGISHALEVETPVLGSFSSSSHTEIESPSTINAQNMELSGSLVMAMLFAFMGGIILNLMPCVLPIISFKILGFVKMAGQSRKLIMQHGLCFALGVLLSFWLLAGLLLALRAYGHAIGWGFQLQEPIFVAALATVLLLLSLSLFGLFEFGTSIMSLAGQVQTKETRSGSLLSGVLATAVATPCTGPFLGSAIGFAIAAPAWEALSIFTALGIGMSFPYILLSSFPILLRFMPKPGAWMNTFKELMGFLMLISVLWLIWVFGAQTNALAVSILLGSFIIFAIGCWIYGKWGTIRSSKWSRLISKGLLLICFGVGIYGMTISTEPWVLAITGKELIAGKSNADWEPFSPNRVAELQRKGVPVLVDFTAKWCLICQVNHLVLTQDDIANTLKERGVVKMKADWTKRDPMITEELRKQGRSGVPLYLLYSGNPKEPPQILPQVLTPEIVLQYVSAL